MQVIHTGDTRASSKGVIIDHIPLKEFEDEWVQVETEMHYTNHGSFRIKITRISDGKVLMNQDSGSSIQISFLMISICGVAGQPISVISLVSTVA